MITLSLTTSEKEKIAQHCQQTDLHVDNLSAMEITELLYPNSKEAIRTFLSMYIQTLMLIVEINKITYFVLPDNISMLFNLTDEPYESISDNLLFLPVTDVNHNCSKNGVYWCKYYLLFTSKHSFDNWQYYGGLQYAENVEIINVNGRFWALYDAQSDDRIKDIIDRQLEEN